MATCKCIDISHYQGFPDFEEVAGAGVLAVIHKATEGTGYSDPNRGSNLANARAAGLAIATYHFLRPGNMAAQMDYYLDVVEPVQGERMILDHEDAGVSVTDLRACVERLLDISDTEGLDLQITVYSGHVLKEQLGSSRDDYLAEHTDLWVAQYGVSSPSWPSGTYPTYSLWQYSESGRIPGIDDGYVDLNEFNGSDENLLKWMGPAEAPVEPPEQRPPRPPRPPRPAEAAAVEIITTGEVILTVNGRVIPSALKGRVR